MSGSLPAGQLQRLDSLITSGLLSDCEIGRRLKLSHTAVWRRRQLLLERPGKECELVRTTMAADERYVPGPSGKFRCPDCGGQIYILPCRLCKCRRQIEADQAARAAGLVTAEQQCARLVQRQFFTPTSGRHQSSGVGGKASGASGQASGASDGPDLVEGATMPTISGPGSSLVEHYRRKAGRSKRSGVTR